ncbi:hypothetical protein MKK68_15850 [Methylobacterium sp. E-016]|uniref:hypothetical protein n=1 Tax=Methylobacterium sp. E-016 TaxID=2836556 RepID=UPI001FB9AC6D|nr:hypothetical protein [Methylobacterium sp. E-016]MCJ2077105.1 hypothetical protein [Methylobacterium sp. E-016]
MDVASEVRRRNDLLSAEAVHDAIRAALRDALHDLADARGAAYLDAFLARRLQIAESLRTRRRHEPEALAAARRRNSDAMEVALREVVAGIRP